MTKNPHAVALGRLGGLKGGKARAAVLSPRERQEIARKASTARWKKEGARAPGRLRISLPFDDAVRAALAVPPPGKPPKPPKVPPAAAPRPGDPVELTDTGFRAMEKRGLTDFPRTGTIVSIGDDGLLNILCDGRTLPSRWHPRYWRRRREADTPP